jgi:hypothetical protein
MLAAIGGVQAGDAGDEEAFLAEERAAEEAGRGAGRDLTGVIAQEGQAPRIVAGIDGSSPTEEALRWAVRQAELTGGSSSRSSPAPSPSASYSTL